MIDYGNIEYKTTELDCRVTGCLFGLLYRFSGSHLTDTGISNGPARYFNSNGYTGDSTRKGDMY